MKLTIVLRKDVADEAEGQAVFDIVKTRLADRPDVEISGSTSSQCEDPE